MLTGHQLFVGNTLSDTLAGVLRDEPKLAALPHETPAAARRLARRCLEKDVHERLADAATARLELEDALAGRGDLEGEVSAATTPSWQRILPWALLAASALALVAVLATSKSPAGPPQRPVRLKTELSTDPLFVRLGSSVVLSPDGRWLGFTTPGELKKVPITGGTPMALCEVDRSRGATWTVDDIVVFAPSGSSPLRKVSATGGDPNP